MKRILTISFSCVLALGFFSCKNSVEVVKRHYGNGYYISSAKKKHAVKEENVAGKQAEKRAENVAALNVIPVKQIHDARPEPVVTASLTEETTVLKKASGTTIPFIASRSEKSTRPAVKTAKHKNALATAEHRGGTDNAIVLIILCIFIPPLAVFLKEDKIGTNFWVDLILTLLFFVPGIIFAFLVCFDII